MTMTDLSALPVPNGLTNHLRATSRSEAVIRHSVRIDPEWWRNVLRDQGFGAAAVLPDGHDAEGSPTLSRGGLFELVRETRLHLDDESVLRVLWHVLAWGAGTGARNNRRRVAAIAETRVGAVEALVMAMNLSRTDPAAAYSCLRPGRKNVVGWLGPAFFTKILYFAGEGDPVHKSVILDDRVAGALRDRCRWDSLRTGGGWPALTYARYSDLLGRWAADLAEPVERSVAPDEIERWLFCRGPKASPSR